jgi:hypothetical protein
MGGMGSGRIGGFGSATTNDLQKIDLAWMRREGILKPGCSGSMTWSRGGHRTAEIRYEVRHHGLRVYYRVTPYAGAPFTVDETIPFAFSAQPFGGQKTWFSCPACRRRASTLFGGRYFRCRRCHGLKFKSQYEAPYDRAIERANRIREKLGDKLLTALEADELPQKPKRMRWRTYRKLEVEYRELQLAWKCGLIKRFGLQVLQ